MALLTTYGAGNLVENQLSATRENRTLMAAYGVWFWLIESTTTESYSYVGMTRDAAKTCADAMVLAYTKTKRIPSVQGGVIVYESVVECVADVRAVRTSGHMWQVNVEVNDVARTMKLAAAR